MNPQTYQIHFRDGSKTGGGSLRDWRNYVFEQRVRGVLSDDVTMIAVGMTVYMASKDHESLIPFTVEALARACSVSKAEAQFTLETLQRTGLLSVRKNNVVEFPSVTRARSQVA